MSYNWQQKDWPNFRYSLDGLDDLFYEYTRKVGRTEGFMQGLQKDIQIEAIVNLMVTEAIKTSAIEGEYLSRQDVLSSVRNNFGLNQEHKSVSDARAEGAARLMIDVYRSYEEKLTKEKLFAWHSMVMKGSRGVLIGKWRDHEEPMQVVSGALGKERIHFEAPPSHRVDAEMDGFLDWFNQTGPGGQQEIRIPVIRSAIAHLYFETIHPFEDGNGRIGRAISEKAMSQQARRPILISLSRTIEADKKAYYRALQKAQQSNEITPWLIYFLRVAIDAQNQTEALIDFTLKKTKFFDRYAHQLNERQLKVIRRMLEEGPQGFEGGMSAKKYIAIAHTSKATATRDLQDLAEKQVFLPFGGGRSIKYALNLEITK